MEIGRSALAVLVSLSRLSRIARFGAAGLMATLCYFVLANALAAWGGLPPLSASVVAYLASLMVSYLLQSRFTFRVKQDSAEQVSRFIVTALAGLALCWLITHVTVVVLSWSYLAATVLICILVPLVNYFVFKSWVFARGLRRPQREDNCEER